MIKVLIVEDDPMVLEVNKQYLSKLTNFTLVDSAKTGEEALEKIKNNDMDLVLLDIYLPDISGVELLKSIRDLNIPIDVITVTAARDSETVHRLFRLGVIDYLVKPFHYKRFKSALENYERFWYKLKHKEVINQDDIDFIRDQELKQTEVLPKGLNDITLNQIMIALLKQEEAVTAEELAQYLGLARVTVRRYLDYLVKQQKINVNLKYGQVGRPTHYYSI